MIVTAWVRIRRLISLSKGRPDRHPPPVPANSRHGRTARRGRCRPRGRGYAIRIWDNERSARITLPPLKWFPVNKHFRVTARYSRYKQPQVMGHPDTFGEMVEDRIDGYVTFRFEGKTYKLDVSETKDHKLFIKFRDQTSNKESYPPSRYQYTEPVKDGKVVVDFNYSYSPPCAFTEYATCIFAPPQNTLPFRVEAGEIYRG